VDKPTKPIHRPAEPIHGPSLPLLAGGALPASPVRSSHQRHGSGHHVRSQRRRWGSRARVAGGGAPGKEEARWGVGRAATGSRSRLCCSLCPPRLARKSRQHRLTSLVTPRLARDLSHPDVEEHSGAKSHVRQDLKFTHIDRHHQWYKTQCSNVLYK